MCLLTHPLFYVTNDRSSQTKSEKRKAPTKDSGSSLTKPKQSKAPAKGLASRGQPTVNRATPSDVGSGVKEQTEEEWTEFPDIETMPAKVDDCKLCMHVFRSV